LLADRGKKLFLGNEAKTFGKPWLLRPLSKSSDLKGSMCTQSSSTIHFQTSDATDAIRDHKFPESLSVRWLPIYPTQQVSWGKKKKTRQANSYPFC
jgi:hypothetical protein